ncbi:hypothetical protein [Escherichia coli]|uniref:hypothetical protein n=1 Tax=Escherichia coli TaxID=562 RepID=UPI00388F63AA
MLYVDICCLVVMMQKRFFKFYNTLPTQNINVLQFVPEIEISSSQDENDRIIAVKEKYGISGDYFFLPNQFWKHKNHELVIKAIITGDIPAKVVATGASNDYRGGRHIELINQLLKQDSAKNSSY